MWFFYGDNAIAAGAEGAVASVRPDSSRAAIGAPLNKVKASLSRTLE